MDNECDKPLVKMEKEGPLAESLYFTIKTCKQREIKICKPLLPLKIVLFLFWGAGSFLVPFLIVLYKQRGITVSQIAVMTMCAPAMQYCGTMVSGIIADKSGRSKHVLVVNLLITIITIFCITLLPSTVNSSCEPRFIYRQCTLRGADGDLVVPACKVSNCLDGHHSESVIFLSDENIIAKCGFVDVSCDKFNIGDLRNASVEYEEMNDTTYAGFNSYRNCSENRSVLCDISCAHASQMCTDFNNLVFLAHFALFVTFYTGFTCSYNCLDITTVFMVEKYSSDYGYESIWGHVGSVLLSLLSGVVADATTSTDTGDRNCTSVLYLYISITVLTLGVISKLPICMKPPGEKMFSKFVNLLKDPHMAVYFALLLFMGTCWNLQNFFKLYLLEDIHAPSMVIAIASNICSMYSLPLLLWSKWWMSKVRAQNFFVLSLIGHGVNFLGYSYLQNPWLSLACEVSAVAHNVFLWMAVLEYITGIAPEGLHATLIAASAGVHWTMGKATSGFLGRTVLAHFGTRLSFRYSAIVCFVVAVLYAVYTYCTGKCRHKGTSGSKYQNVMEEEMKFPLSNRLQIKHSKDSEKQILLQSSDSD